MRTATNTAALSYFDWSGEETGNLAGEAFGLLGKESHNPLTLSGGEQQRVGIARAVVHKPKILLADEPTGNLDPALSTEIMALFRRFQSVGVTILIATHDINLINSLDHRIMHLEDGMLTDDGVRSNGQ